MFNSIKAMLEKTEVDIRFQIIYFLNKHYNKYCWADLVIWALKYREWEDVNLKGGCLDRAERPYCGNCYSKDAKKKLPYLRDD